MQVQLCNNENRSEAMSSTTADITVRYIYAVQIAYNFYGLWAKLDVNECFEDNTAFS
jgi:hypothetical protein